MAGARRALNFGGNSDDDVQITSVKEPGNVADKQPKKNNSGGKSKPIEANDGEDEEVGVGIGGAQVEGYDLVWHPPNEFGEYEASQHKAFSYVPKETGKVIFYYFY
jgi:hypothetical protein